MRLKAYLSIRLAVGLLALISAAHSSAVRLELVVGHGQVDRAHRHVVVGGVLPAEEEDLPGELLADLAGEVGRAESAVEAGHGRVGLLEAGVLGARQREVAHDVQAVPAAGGPPRHDTDHDLGHEADQPLALEDVQATGPRRVDRPGVVTAGVLVAVLAADPLVATRAERPSAVAGRGPLPVSSTTPTSLDVRAWSRAANSSSTVCGRKALRTSGRSKAMRTVPWSTARW